MSVQIDQSNLTKSFGTSGCMRETGYKNHSTRPTMEAKIEFAHNNYGISVIGLCCITCNARALLRAAPYRLYVYMQLCVFHGYAFGVGLMVSNYDNPHTVRYNLCGLTWRALHGKKSAGARLCSAGGRWMERFWNRFGIKRLHGRLLNST